MGNYFKIICVSFVLLASVSTSLYAQDLIVTSDGDSLNCKITKINTEYIYFTFKHKDEVRSTLLPIGQVTYHQNNYYQTSVVPDYKVIYKEDFPRFRVAINGGWSYRTAKIADNIPIEYDTYMRKIKSGYHYGGEVSYFFSEPIGVGFKYYVSRSGNEMDNVSVINPKGETVYGKMSDDISICFVGSFFSTRLLNASKRNCFITNLGIGYLGYKDDCVLVNNYTIKGSTLGLCWDLGYDIGMTKNLALGFQLSYIIGTLTQYEVSDGNTTENIELDEGYYESLSHIDLSVGLRFNIK